MNVTTQQVSYESTNYFSKIVIDYIHRVKPLQPFYKHPVSIKGIKAAIEKRKKYPTNRKLLADILSQQYKNISLTKKQQLNIQQLNNINTFTITTAHQPNIFTGPLYFIYKIIHAIKLAEQLQKELPEYHFVPVYYMGSEDADLEELNHVHINGQKHEWKTNQTGAVGRMKVDKNLLQLIQEIEREIAVHPFGAEIIQVIKACYAENITIEQATFSLVNHLFDEYGLIILLPDDAQLKKIFTPILEKELMEQFSHKMIQETVSAFPDEYKLKAIGRELNLFYLRGDSRERIERSDDRWIVVSSQLTFDKNQITKELRDYPERFSPNVVLRPVYQEMILPNIVFIGGGSEIAYWLQLKKVFRAVSIPFPVMVLRNSFLIIDKNINNLAKKLFPDIADVFKNEEQLLNELAIRKTNQSLSLSHEKETIKHIYECLKSKVETVDTTLQKHVGALQTQTLKKITSLEKKILSAEKRKLVTHQRQLHKIKSTLFPHNSLQERIENFLPFYVKWGKDFIKAIYESSKNVEQEFAILIES